MNTERKDKIINNFFFVLSLVVFIFIIFIVYKEVKENKIINNINKKEVKKEYLNTSVKINLKKYKNFFSYPIKNRDIKVSQYFGATAFAAKSKLYKDDFHGGIDFSAPIGTPIYASRDGIVRDVGDTEVSPNCLSSGKWIILDHSDGISSGYYHLSKIQTFPNAKVKKGSLIGYSGDTGLATNPHLHFSVYKTEMVSVVENKEGNKCRGVDLIEVAEGGYFNPMDFLNIK